LGLLEESLRLLHPLLPFVTEEIYQKLPEHGPSIMSAPYPEWGPKLAKGRRVSITASYVVTEEGLVTDIRVERGGGVLEAILVEISTWKYVPGTKGGVPVKVRVRMKHTSIGG
jgi:leucyl-tRNA synthetase